MLGNLSLLNNSIFLSVRWLVVLHGLFLVPLTAQTALRSPNFIFYSNTHSVRQAESGLARLEQLRAAILALHGPNWAPQSPLRIWLPRNEAEWRTVASKSTEQGLFLSGERGDWIVVNPAAPAFLEVLSHEYIHAVLHRTLPNLPTWFEEGICEYYSTLTLRHKGGITEAILGRPPGRRLAELKEVSSVNLPELANGIGPADTYALAWAAAYLLWPGYVPGASFPASVPVGPFPVRLTKINYTPPDTTTRPLSPTQMHELEEEFRQRVPTATNITVSDAYLAEQRFLEGLALSDNGRAVEALPLLEQACRLRPSNSTWWHALALAAKEADRRDLARTAITRALDTAANDGERTAAKTFAASLQP